MTERQRSEGYATEVALDKSSDRRCSHCDTRGGDFAYKDQPLCCECMTELCSWFLDGGQVEAPDLFAYLLEQPSHNGAVDA